jgi:hypothetical protein
MIGTGQAAVDLVYAAVYGSREATAAVPVDLGENDPDDDRVLERALAARPILRRLWEGDTGAYGDDESEWEWALSRDLLKETKLDADQAERLARRFEALKREKWDSPRGDVSYIRYTIDRAREDILANGIGDNPTSWPEHQAPSTTANGNGNGHHDEAPAACPRPCCRERAEERPCSRPECAELRKLHSEVGRVITSSTIPNERKAPYLSLLIYAKARQTYPERDPESGEFVSPVVTANSFVRLPKADNCKRLLGMSYAQQIARRKELVAAGVLEERKEVAIIELDGRHLEIEVPYINPGERPLSELVRSLHTIVTPAPSGKRGGKRVKRCEDHLDAPLKEVCSICGKDPIWIEIPPEPTPISKFETGTDASDPDERDDGPRLWGPFPNTGVGNSNGHAHTVDRTSSVNFSNGPVAAPSPPISKFETGPPGDGQHTGGAAARAYAQSAAEQACTCCGIPSAPYHCPRCRQPSGNRIVPCHPCLYGAGP